MLIHQYNKNGEDSQNNIRLNIEIRIENWKRLIVITRIYPNIWTSPLCLVYRGENGNITKYEKKITSIWLMIKTILLSRMVGNYQIIPVITCDI